MLHDYAVRITHSQADVMRVIRLWATRCYKIIAYEHQEEGKKIHCHLLIQGSNVEKKQLRNIGNEVLNLKGNENCSFKAFDENLTYLTYMSKGKFDPFYIQNYSTEEITEAKNKWVPPENYVKETSNEKLYNEFYLHLFAGEDEAEEYVFETKKYKHFRNKFIEENPFVNTDPRFEYIRSKARNFAFIKNKRLATGKFFTEYKMLLCSFCFREALPIPKDNAMLKSLL